MNPCSTDSPASDTLPLIVRGRAERLILAGLLTLVVLAVVLTFLRNEAYAIVQGRDYAAQVTAAGSVPQSVTQVTHTVCLPLVARFHDPNSYPNCRFGVGERHHPVISYSVASLNVGWYMDWKTQTSPVRPGGAEYVQMLHVNSSSYSPSGSTLAARIAANPGALWLIGNEPDCIYQDDVLPQDYAQAYHDAYRFIKENDPTAKVSVGGIVQPTPIRMQYLDIVLDTYASLYSAPLPTDAWNIHTYILREASCAAYPGACWGAEIPPGINATEGMLYALDDTDDLDIFRQRIVQFRQWMRDRGYRDTPLLISEYGTLLPYYEPESLFYDSEGNPFDEERARDYMYGTFDFLLTASDQNLGYLADENRLVQRWLWYSLDDIQYGGALFDRFTHGMMQLGTDFGAYTDALSPTVDLVAVDVEQMTTVSSSARDAVTVTLQARVSNVGTVAIAQPIAVRFLDGEGHQIGSDQVISKTVGGCAAAQLVTTTWSNVTPGSQVVRAVVDPNDDVNEEREDNNEVEGLVTIAGE